MANIGAILWRLCVQRRFRAALLCCCLFSGCHSIPLGVLLAPPAALDDPPPRATFGEPAIAQLVPVLETPTATNDDAAVVQVAALETGPASVAGQRIDLATALRLAGAENPTIALAEEAVRARLAERMQARALLFPNLDLGSNLRLHRGNFLSGGGTVLDVNTQSLYYGFGAGAMGSRTPLVPGLNLVTHLGDAYYAPQAAQAKVVQGRFDATSTHLYILMEVGVRYLALVEAEARLTAYQQSLQEFAEIERLTTNFDKAGAGRKSDAERARAEAMLVRADVEGMQEAIGVAAAELARLLDADPVLSLRAADPVPPILELVDRSLSLPRLLEEALANHPEIVARSADVNYQEIRVRQERVRPFLPTIAIGFSAGDFGGGNESSVPRLQKFAGRTDFDVAAVWSLQNLGLGNRALQNVARAGVEAAYAERARTIDRIRTEVAEAYALTEARRQEMELARRRIDLAQRAYTQDLTRIRNMQGLPLEVLESADQLKTARQDLVHAMIGYSQAQLRLFAALGNAPR